MINADVVMIMGGNPAEDHPIAMNWLTRSQGARRLHPARRPALQSHQLNRRRGCQAALGHRHRLRGRHDPVRASSTTASSRSTSASTPTPPGSSVTATASTDGLFSGFDPAARSYDRGRWAFALDAQGRPAARSHASSIRAACFQLLERHFARYDADTVCRITGTPTGDLPARLRSCYTSTYAPDRAGTWLYAMGHRAAHATAPRTSARTRSCSCCSGNIGDRRRRRQRHARRVERAGFDGPGTELRRSCPAISRCRWRRITRSGRPTSSAVTSGRDRRIRARELAAEHAEVRREPAQGLVGRARAAGRTSFAFRLPAQTRRRVPGNRATRILALTHAMLAGQIKGLFCFGQNPAVGGANARLDPGRRSTSSNGWSSPISSRTRQPASGSGPGVDPAKIPTEVFVLPARLRRREGGQHRQQRPLGAVATSAP